MLRKLILLLCLGLLSVPVSASNLARDAKVELVLGGPATSSHPRHGRAPDIDIVDGLVPITSAEVYWQPTSFLQLEVISSIASDAFNGLGAREACIVGLNGSWVEKTECFATAGTVASSPSQLSYFRVFSFYVSEAGTYTGSNNGTMTLRVAGAGATVATISANAGTSEISGYSTSLTKTCALLSNTFTVASGKDATVTGTIKTSIDDVASPHVSRLAVFAHASGRSGSTHTEYESPVGIPPGSDLIYSAEATANDTAVSVEASMLCRDTL